MRAHKPYYLPATSISRLMSILCLRPLRSRLLLTILTLTSPVADLTIACCCCKVRPFKRVCIKQASIYRRRSRFHEHPEDRIAWAT
jgi:hypothetical protein